MQLEFMYGINWPQGATTEEKKAAREKFAAGPLLTILGMYGERLKRSSGPFLLGGQISLADLWTYFNVSGILKGWVSAGRERVCMIVIL